MPALFFLILLLCFTACILLLRLGLPGFGNKLTILAIGLALFSILSRSVRFLPSPLREQWLTPHYYHFVLLPGTAILIACLLCLASAPFWFFLGRMAQKKTVQGTPKTQAASQPQESGVSRRQALATLSMGFPAIALGTAFYGTLIGSQSLSIKRLRLSIPNLPKSLYGFRIGQITDAHIAHDFTMIQTLEQACQLLSSERLDLLVTTGDLCDHAPLFQEVTSLLSQVKTRLGHYACLGNHEVYVGLNHVRAAHQRAALHLLENTHVDLGELRIAGINYPSDKNPQMKIHPFLTEQFLNQALPEQQANAPLTLLLSHHPHAIKQAKHRCIDLVLSGHLHGGQLAIGDYSIIEPIYGYTKGLYQLPNPQASSKQTQLFVSNGMGHWLPFRIGSPPEVVVIELHDDHAT